MARKMSAQTANAVETMIHEYDDAIENFDETMTHVYETEIERLEAERQYLEFLASNAGKDKSYFQIPSFLTKKQSLKKRLKDIRMQKEGSWNRSNKIAKNHMSSKPTKMMKKKSVRKVNNTNQSFMQVYNQASKIDTFSTTARVGRKNRSPILELNSRNQDLEGVNRIAQEHNI